MFKGQDEAIIMQKKTLQFYPLQNGGGMLTFRGFSTFIMPLVQYYLTPQEFTKVNR